MTEPWSAGLTTSAQARSSSSCSGCTRTTLSATCSHARTGTSSPFPAIAEDNEVHEIATPFGPRRFARQIGEALHPAREPIATLDALRRSIGDYNFSGQYQQRPAPLGGGMIKEAWFKRYDIPPADFDQVIQSWDTANKVSELADFSVCTTWGLKENAFYLLHVLRKKLSYPDLKRAVQEQRHAFAATVILIEDKASGTQLIQDLLTEGTSQW